MSSNAVMDVAPDWLGLAGRVCVVTGGGSGIGAGTARELAACGAAVAVLDRDGKGAAAVAAEIVAAGGRAISLTADVTRVEEITAAAEQVQRELGTCQVLVNNAALVGYVGPLMDSDMALWDRMLGVNLTGALICTRVFGKQMINAGAGGSVINVASICGHTPLMNAGAYSVGKSGMMMMTRLLSVELASHRIRCNSVSPGLVRTPATEAAYVDPETALARGRVVPSGRVAEPLDLANVITFMASDRSAYINGQDILVDGALNQVLMNFIPKPPKPMPPS